MSYGDYDNLRIRLEDVHKKNEQGNYSAETTITASGRQYALRVNYWDGRYYCEFRSKENEKFKGSFNIDTLDDENLRKLMLAIAHLDEKVLKASDSSSGRFKRLSITDHKARITEMPNNSGDAKTIDDKIS